MVEQWTENPRVTGSIPVLGIMCASGSVVEHRLAKARVASSNLVSRFSLSSKERAKKENKKMLIIIQKFDRMHLVENDVREWLSGRASPCQGEGREFESRLALLFSTNCIMCASGSVVEHRLAKARVASSNLVSRFKEVGFDSDQDRLFFLYFSNEVKKWKTG